MDQTENQQTVARTKVGLNNLPAVGRGEGTNSHRNGSVTRWQRSMAQNLAIL